MTYNVNLYSNSIQQLNILNKILEKKCDIIGLQEAFWFNPKVESRFNMYNHVENDGGSNYYKSIVLFNKAKFTLLDNVKKNLHNRGVNVLKLKDNKIGKTFVVINVHLDHMWNGINIKGKNQLRKTTQLLNDALKMINYQKGEHVIFMGDTNEYYSDFKKKYGFPLDLDYSVKLWLKDAGLSCCSKDKINKKLEYMTDVMGTNNQDSLINLTLGDEWGKEYSDHTWITA